MARINNLSIITIPGFSLGFAIAWIFGLHRDLAKDAAQVCKRLKPQYDGLENIPADGPVVVVPNHYGHDNLHVLWTMFAITNAIFKKRDPSLSTNERIPTWMAQDQAPNRENGQVRSREFTRWVFRRVLRVYGIIPHDPLPERRTARAAALHTLVQKATGRGAGQDGKPSPIVIFPEGRTSADRTLVAPPQGAGTMLGLMARSGLRFLPAGAYEQNDVYKLRFGPVFELPRNTGTDDKTERDGAWSTSVMNHISALMPPELRGPYAPPLEEKTDAA